MKHASIFVKKKEVSYLADYFIHLHDIVDSSQSYQIRLIKKNLFSSIWSFYTQLKVIYNLTAIFFFVST